MKKYAGFWDGSFEVSMNGDCGGSVKIKTPFDISSSPEEVAEIVREFWKEVIVPLQLQLLGEETCTGAVTSRELQK